MNILIYTHEFYPFRGGIANWTLEMVKGLVQNSHNVTVLAPKYTFKSQPDPDLPGIRIRRMPLATKGRISYFVGLLYFPFFLMFEKYDKVIVCDATSQVVASIVGYLLRANYVVIVHGTEILMHYSRKSFYQKIKANIITLFFSRAVIIANSHATKNLLLQKACSSLCIAVVYCCIDEKYLSIKPQSHVLFSETDLRTRHILLTVARLYPRKGHDMVLRSLVDIKESIPEVLYLIVGDGINRKVLEELVFSLRLQDHVIFTGSVPDIIPYLDLCDIFVMPSREDQGIEGFGISYLEAMARGKPVIGGRHGGVPEVIVDGVNGYLVDSNSIPQLSAAINRLLLDPELAEELGNHGKKIVESRFTTRVMIKTFLNVLSKSL